MLFLSWFWGETETDSDEKITKHGNPRLLYPSEEFDQSVDLATNAFYLFKCTFFLTNEGFSVCVGLLQLLIFVGDIINQTLGE